MLSQLPPLCVDSMTQVQLSEFIPRLIQLVTGRAHPFFGKSQFRPEWWPDDIPWANPDMVKEENRKSDESHMETLRKVIRSCYKHEGQENLLTSINLQQSVVKSGSGGDVSFQTSKILSTHDENTNLTTYEKTQSMFSHESDNPKSPAELLNNMPIWVCFLCAKQFSHQDELMTHQEICEQNADQEEETLPSKPPVPVVLRKVVKRKRWRRFKPELYEPPPLDVYIKSLDLIEKLKNDSDIISPQKKDVDSDCEIDVSDYEQEQSGPVAPRTPKSLMSQLSREGHHGDISARKRQLSFSQNISDSESGDESESQKKSSSTPAINSLLYGIDLCSPLGHRVKKHLKFEGSVPVVRNYDQYCCGHEKNEFIEKLRQRDNSYPVVFNKKRKKFCARFFHRYKFSSKDRYEFMLRLKTGLNKRARQLLSEMEPCSVKLKRLDPDVIKEWCRPKPRKFPMPGWYRGPRPVFGGPRQPMFGGLRRPMFGGPRRPMFGGPYRQAYRPPFRPFMNRSRAFPTPNRFRSPITPSHPAFQEALTKPVFGPKSARIKQINQNIAHLNRGPTKYMVTQVITNPDGTETMKIVCVEGNEEKNMNQMRKSSQGPDSPLSRRKQTFNQERMKQMDDEIIIIEMSSSEDEGDAYKSTQKCKLCDSKTGKKCAKHNEQKSPVPSVINHGGNMYLSRPIPRATSHMGNLSVNPSSSRAVQSVKIHPSPPGARTVTELGLSNISSLNQSSASRNIKFGTSRIGALSGIHSPQKTGLSKGPSPSMQGLGCKSGPVLQKLLTAPNEFPMHAKIVTGPKGERTYVCGNSQGEVRKVATLPKPQPPPPHPVMKVPNYSIEKRTISGDDKTEVDVICIDDDDD
ncbi:hypothetical protein KUTeg_021216 [Tegillarca granosa]|uniref:C2H2-type domain-containing protein n=1 Tax=Tegillarca granosa TaxID=220873 RepID=A0ABQ9EA46_TEGGR|nr:hypothetical protein KUTeg_021216 [Tegillarca granosa]